MDILSLIGWRTEGLEKSTGSQSLALEVGDHIRGQVSRLLHQKLAVVELYGGRIKAIAELKTPLNPGQRLDLKVTATAPRLTFQVLAGDKGVGSAAPTPSASGPAPLQAHLQLLEPQQVRSLVSELQTLAMVLKSERDRGASAAGMSTATGTEATKVSSALLRLADHLKPIDPQNDPKTTATQLRVHIRDGGQLFLQKLVDTVQARGLEQARLPEQVNTPAQEIATEASGQNPSRLNGSNTPPPGSEKPLLHPLKTDLKPQLLRLLTHLPTLMDTLDPGQRLSAEGSRQLWSTVAVLLEEMESTQTRLSEHRPEDPPAVMRHSMWVEGRDAPLRLNVYLPRKRGRKDPAAFPMVSLLLDLKRFGAVRVDIRERLGNDDGMGIRHQQQQLKVNFWMDSQVSCDAMSAAMTPLTEILETLYPFVDLSVSMSPDKIATFEQEAGPIAPSGIKAAKLDIRV